MENMLNVERLRDAMAGYAVTLDTSQIAELATLVLEVRQAYSAEIADESIADLTGGADAGQLEIATADARKVFKSVLTLVGGSFECPAVVGDVDPLMSAVMRLLPPSTGNLLEQGEAAAGATRRVAQIVQDALAAASPEDLSLLKGIKIVKEDAVRPKLALDLSRRVIRAAYYFSHEQGKDMTLSVGLTCSPIVKLCLATLKALELPGQEEVIRAEINAYRRELRVATEAKGIFDKRSPVKGDFIAASQADFPPTM
jgi:hypothetical protein